MDTARLGNSGLKVSRICLGCMSYGNPDAVAPDGSRRAPWVLREEESRPFFKRALEAGINFFDTANVYSMGASEEVTGRALWSMAKRQEIVLATKVHGAMSKDPNGHGLSRRAIHQEVENSLKRLNTDYIDLYQIHRWDPETPIEETMSALHELVQSGKVRYLGASSMHAWQFAKAQYLAERHGWTKFISMQNHYNLLYREEEREMNDLCIDEGVGLIPWSPLARGRLARGAAADAKTTRAQTDRFGKSLYGSSADADAQVLARVDELAKSRGLPNAQIALAWLLGKPGVTAPIIGATKMNHLEDAIAALGVKLSGEEVKRLEEPYIPHAVAGF